MEGEVEIDVVCRVVRLLVRRGFLEFLACRNTPDVITSKRRMNSRLVEAAVTNCFGGVQRFMFILFMLSLFREIVAISRFGAKGKIGWLRRKADAPP